MLRVAQLDSIAALVRDVLGPAALGAYLHGSTGTGRLQPTSDLDVLVVTSRPMAVAERERLVAAILRLSGRRAVSPGRPIELTVVVGSDVRPWRYPPTEDFLYGEWERRAYEAGVLPTRRVNPDLAPLITMVLEAARPLFGPPPDELLDPVPAGDLRTAMLAAIPALVAELDDDTRNVLLTLARIWMTLETGAIHSKDEAADWSIERLPAVHRPVLERARDAYRGPDNGRFDDLAADVRPCAEALVGAIGVAAALRTP